MDQLLTCVEFPYSANIRVVPLPPRFKVPQIHEYNESKDLLEHLENFKEHTTLHGFLSQLACRAFPLTLREAARAWFGALLSRTITSFIELSRLFLTQFMASRKRM